MLFFASKKYEIIFATEMRTKEELKQIFKEKLEAGDNVGSIPVGAVSNLLRDSVIRESYPHLFSPLQFLNKNFCCNH
ncbi:hypothetical protein LguiA_031727 [Lonicera macranthoides]